MAQSAVDGLELAGRLAQVEDGLLGAGEVLPLGQPQEGRRDQEGDDAPAPGGRPGVAEQGPEHAVRSEGGEQPRQLLAEHDQRRPSLVEPDGQGDQAVVDGEVGQPRDQARGHEDREDLAHRGAGQEGGDGRAQDEGGGVEGVLLQPAGARPDRRGQPRDDRGEQRRPRLARRCRGQHRYGGQRHRGRPVHVGGQHLRQQGERGEDQERRGPARGQQSSDDGRRQGGGEHDPCDQALQSSRHRTPLFPWAQSDSRDRWDRGGAPGRASPGRPADRRTLPNR